MIAFFIDFVLLYGIGLGGAWFGTVVNGSNTGSLILVVLLVVFGLYLVGLITAVALRGRSVGLWVLGLRIVRIEDGRAPGFPAALARAGLTACFIFWPWAIIVFISTLVDQSGRSLLDKVTGTLMTEARKRAV